jgi:hypothetical protein
MTFRIALPYSSNRYETTAVQSIEGLPQQQQEKVTHRQPRCKHGFVCVDDGNPTHWACPKCKNPREVNVKSKRVEYRNDLLDVLRQHPVANYVAARQALIDVKGITKTIKQIKEAVGRLRKNGHLEGFRVVTVQQNNNQEAK